ncbi:MAG: phosphoribosylamine--glycine ligase [Bacilli bacterium]|nr:phosphoribosylamine--glycine ligase [Bacilli bacterium]
MKVLVIGSGGREHAIIDKLSESSLVDKIYAAPGNDGMAKQAELVAISDTDVEALLEFALEKNIDLTVVGPEVSLAAGVVDAFKAKGLKIFGPDKKAARIESSKEYAKELMKKYHIPTADFQSFSSYEEAWNYVQEKGAPIVIKYDGLAAGKGVVVAMSLKEAQKALKDMLVDDKYGKDKVVIEEYLEGPEFSFLCFVDGKNVYPLELSQDHKRAFDDDEGPNTGGMGAYSPLPFITKEDREEALEKIMKPTAAALVDDDSSFTGVLYGGLMKTKDGIKVIEFNCRFGDPETEVVLPRLESDLFVAFNKVIDHEDPELVWDNQVCLGVVLASEGYPGSYEKMHAINGLEKVTGKVYAMGVKIVDGQTYNNGGRVLIIVEKADTVAKAREKALDDIKKIESDNLFYRSDIGHWAL